MVWRFWTGETVESQDRQWARRQAAEAQNHIFDRCVSVGLANSSFYAGTTYFSASFFMGDCHPSYFCLGDPHSPLFFSFFFGHRSFCSNILFPLNTALASATASASSQERTASSSCQTTSPAPPPSAQSYTPAVPPALPCRGARPGWAPIVLRKAQ